MVIITGFFNAKKERSSNVLICIEIQVSKFNFPSQESHNISLQFTNNTSSWQTHNLPRIASKDGTNILTSPSS